MKNLATQRTKARDGKKTPQKASSLYPKDQNKGSLLFLKQKPLYSCQISQKTMPFSPWHPREGGGWLHPCYTAMKHLKPSAEVVAERLRLSGEVGFASLLGGNDPPISLGVSGDYIGNLNFHPTQQKERVPLGGQQRQMESLYHIHT